MAAYRCGVDGCQHDGEWVRVEWIGSAYPQLLCCLHWSDLRERLPDEAAFYMHFVRGPRRHAAARPQKAGRPVLRLVDTREERLTAVGW